MLRREKRIIPALGGHRPDPDMPVLDGTDLLRRVDLCFVLDATGSMKDYIDAARRELQAFAQTLANHRLRPQMRYALILYRDHPPEDTTFITKNWPLTEELTVIQAALNSAGADGGGDGPEAVIDGLYDAIFLLEWRQGAHKVVVLAGDAPPHGVGGAGDAFSEGCPCGHDLKAITDQAAERGITIFALGIGNDASMQKSFQQIARDGKGRYLALKNARVLIDEIMSVIIPEFGKVEIDIRVRSVYRPGMSAREIASKTGIDMREVEASIIRLRQKEVIK